ncbi:MarC family protein [Zavarzinia compransoris]|uniref:MarC family protein n=1 Tax=Zavarzinia marina TaxID=2911065 RepID=UPI001F41C434|nr:MarC family protein [Zavarzinia marina]MCF4164909.1 MarC family protein [Zavarzinia marina]
MIETFLISFTTFFATIGPADVAVLFAALTGNNTPAERRGIALKGTLFAGGIMVIFGLIGDPLLRMFGISLPALRVAGGILLLLISLDMVFVRHSGGNSTTDEEEAEAMDRPDISVVPLATPLLAGPGAIGSIILLTSATDDPLRETMVFLGLAAVLAVGYLMMLAATGVQRVLGVTGVHVISRIFGVLLAALAVQFVFDGLKTSGLFNIG